MIAMIKTSPNCEAILKQEQWRQQIKRHLGPFKMEVIHLSVISFIYSFKQTFTGPLLYTELS